MEVVIENLRNNGLSPYVSIEIDREKYDKMEFLIKYPAPENFRFIDPPRITMVRRGDRSGRDQDIRFDYRRGNGKQLWYWFIYSGERNRGVEQQQNHDALEERILRLEKENAALHDKLSVLSEMIDAVKE